MAVSSTSKVNITSIMLTVLMVLFTIVNIFQVYQVTEQNEKIKIQNEIISRQNVILTSLPDIYVRLERYLSDQKVSLEGKRAEQEHVNQMLCDIKDNIKELRLLIQQLHGTK